MANTITAQQRMAYFNQSTRQNIHTLPSMTGGATENLQINLPKARLLSKIFMKVDATVNMKHASNTSVVVNPHKLLRRISLDLNNGFSPYTVSGYQLHLLNLMSVRAESMESMSQSERTFTVNNTTNGSKNEVSLFYELPVCMNERDTPQGLILLQNSETNVTLSVDTANGLELVEGKTGYTVNIESIKVSCCTETFSLPAVQEAFPDLSILKLTNGVNHQFMGNGVNQIKLSTGTIYRKLIFIFTDEDGNPLEDSDFTSNLELVFNQADINYSIPFDMLRKINTMGLNHEMPKGVYYLDFSSQGFSNFGGTRDLIDTELLTEFTVQFGTSKMGKVSIVSECIARVK